MSTIRELAPRLWKYLEGPNPKGHLKVLATIPEAKHPEVTAWAIFWSVESSKSIGDPTFIGDSLQAGSKNTKLGWKTDRPLWLIPISEAARNEAIDKIESDKAASIRFPSPRIQIRNPGPGYYFWPSPNSEIPLLLHLPADSTLEKLSAKGHWYRLKATGDSVEWPVWLMDGEFGEDPKKDDRAILFKSHQSLLRGNAGQPLTRQMWFGVRRTKHQGDDGNAPILAISSEKNAKAFKDCPIVWRITTGRDDDFPSSSDFTAAKWIDDNVFPNWKSAAGGNALQRILSVVSESDQSVSWLLQDEKSDDIWPLFACNPDPKKPVPLLGEKIVNQSLQFCGKEPKIHCRLIGFTYESAVRIWQEKSQPIRDGLMSVRQATSCGVAPALAGTPAGSKPLVSSWMLESWGGGACAHAAGLFAFGEPSQDGWKEYSSKRASISIPNLRNTKGEGLKFTTARLKPMEAQETGAVGTLFVLNIDAQTLATATNELVDGSLAFQLLKQGEKDKPLCSGLLRIALQDKRTRRPIYPWELHSFTYEDTANYIFPSIEVRNLRLAVETVFPAGQDPLPEEGYLAAESLGTATEGAGVRRNPPLIIPLSEPAKAKDNTGSEPKKKKRYSLTYNESINLGQNHRLDVKLEEVDPEEKAQNRTRVVVIDGQPQITALVDCKLLQQSGYDDGAWVLARRSPLSEEQGGWELLDDEAATEGFRLVLPAQVIGEAMVKYAATARAALHCLKVEVPVGGDPIPGIQQHIRTLPHGDQDAWLLLCQVIEAGGDPARVNGYLAGRFFPKEAETNALSIDPVLIHEPQDDDPLRKEKTALLSVIKRSEFDPSLTFPADEEWRLIRWGAAVLTQDMPERIERPTGGTHPGEPEIGKPIESRFGSPALLRLASERLERRYVAVPWNLRRIWGKAGDAAPGAPLLEMRIETIYGLFSHMKPPKAFIAELGAKLGEVPPPPVNSIAWKPTKKQFNSFRVLWRLHLSHYDQWLSRLAVLEPSSDNPFAPATFIEGVKYWPRVTVEYQKVTPEGDEMGWKRTKGADLRWPLTARQKEELEGIIQNPDTSPKLRSDAERLLAAHSNTGLAGGFHYGFESLAIYLELWRELYGKGSSSGEVTAPAFSSVGAWSRETARFANDKSSIKWITGMGRNHFYAVERVGRIGAFWHKARHVIEYERTVVPSRQFADLPEHPGRVLVRKVREFIEILEPTRSYPDFPGDDPAAPGSVLSCTFRSTVIPVRSSWGSDFWAKANDQATAAEPIGWQVPLWKRGADPQIYPKPQIVLHLVPPPDSEEEFIPVNLAEPENLWFYTDTREKASALNGSEITLTADVHAWPPVPEVDYTLQPAPRQADIKPAAGDSTELIGAPLPNAMDVFPGFERWTFRVEPAEIPAAVASRYFPGSGVTGRLRTVTMMRSQAGESAHVDKWWEKDDTTQALAALTVGGDSLLGRMANGFVDLDNEIRLGPAANAQASLTRYREQVVQAFKTAKRNQHTLEGKLKQITKPSAPNLTHFPTLWPKPDNEEDLNEPTKILWREALRASDSAVNQALEFYDTQVDALITELKRIHETGGQYADQAIQALDAFAQRVTAFRQEVEFTVDGAFSTVQQVLSRARAEVERALADGMTYLRTYLDQVDPTPQIDAFKANLIDEVNNVAERLTASLDRLFSNLQKIGPASWAGKVDAVKKSIATKLEAWQKDLVDGIGGLTGEGIAAIAQAKQIITQHAARIQSEVSQALETLHADAQDIVQDAKGKFDELNKSIRHLWEEAWDILAAEALRLRDEWNKGAALVVSKVESELKDKEDVNALRQRIQKKLVDTISNVLYRAPQGVNKPPSVWSYLEELDKYLKELINLAVGSFLELFGGSISPEKIEQWLNTLDAYKRLEDAIQSGDRNAILGASTSLANSINEDLGRFAGEVAEHAKKADQIVLAGQDVAQVGKQTLNNYRSVFDQFTAPGMGFNRGTIAMIVNTDFKDVERRLSLTPVIGKVQQLGKDLEGLGIRLPCVGLTDRLLPPVKEWGEFGKSMLNEFDFSNLMADIGGMKLDKLFPGFKMPAIARDKIKITQGFDKKNLTAWVDARSDITLPGKKSLMNFSVLKVELENGEFIGHLRMDMDASGSVRKTNSGRLTGSWWISLGGTPLMIFKEASVIFKDGKISFDLDPKRMEMPGLLKVLTDATTKLGAVMNPGGGGEDDADAEAPGDADPSDWKSAFRVRLVKVPVPLTNLQLPAGIKASLDIPPTDVSGGVAGMTGLSFGGYFQLTFLKLLTKAPFIDFKFEVGFGFYFGKKEKPFNLTIFILGGGGYIDGTIYYTPSQRGLTVDFAMSVHASVSFQIALGWMSGGVSIMLGFEAEYHKKPEQSADFYASIFIMFVGYVDILRLVSVHLMLLLQATYQSLRDGGTRLVGRGQVKLTIRISRFFKIRVNKSYEKVLAEKKGSSPPPALARARALPVAAGDPLAALPQPEPRYTDLAEKMLANFN
jgi:hypothetical protein